VVDFLRFSEENLAWLRRREIQKAEAEGEAAEFEPPDEDLKETYRNHLVESATYRFDVGLSQSIRYSGLAAFTTAIEFCAKAFLKRLTFSLPPTPREENKHVHLLSILNQKAAAGFDERIVELRNLFRVRNCVVHAAGFVDAYEHEASAREAATTLEGVSIWNEDFLGTSICLKDGAVEKYASAAIQWVPELDKRGTNAGLMK
jgi:hypothetical protein